MSARNIAVALIGVLLTLSMANIAVAQTRLPAFVPGEILIGYSSEDDAGQAVRELNARDGVRMRGEAVPSLRVERIGKTTVKLRVDMPFRMRGAPDDPNAQLQLLKELAAQTKQGNRQVRYAHPNWVMSADELPPYIPSNVRVLDSILTTQSAQAEAVPNDYAYVKGLHWSYLAPPVGMNAVGAWASAKGSRDVVVAVLDSGILLDHPDIKGSGNVLPGYTFVSGKAGRGPDPTDLGDDACPPQHPYATWHGTHVAGIIGAVATNNGHGATGINWEVSVLPVRVLGLCGRGTLNDIADAVRWAAGLPVDGAPTNTHPAHVINLSLGAPVACTPDNLGYLIDALNDARAAGSVIVVAAGNSNMDIRDWEPAGCKGVISVAASDKSGQLSSYSNFGDVTIMAPGGDLKPLDENGFMPAVWSTVHVSGKSPEGIDTMPGTSQAAPHVSGAIALALAKHPEWRRKPDLIEQNLRQSAVAVRSGACPQRCGVGQLDAAKLVDSR